MTSQTRFSLTLILLIAALSWSWYANRNGPTHDIENAMQPDLEAKPDRIDSNPGAALGMPIIDSESAEQVAKVADSFSIWRMDLVDAPALRYAVRHEVSYDQPLAERFDTLVDLAMNGDADAALDLAGGLSACVTSPRNDVQLEQLIDYTNSTRMVEGRAWPVDNLESAVANIRAKYRFCKSISTDMILDHFFYMKLAADNGNLQAKVDMLNYGSMSMEDRNVAYARAWPNKEAQRRDLTQHTADAINAGSASALSSIGNYSDILDLTPAEVAGHDLAFYHQRLMRKRISQDMIDLWTRGANRSFNRLSSSESVEAIEIANELLRRDNCCVFIVRREYLQ